MSEFYSQDYCDDKVVFGSKYFNGGKKIDGTTTVNGNPAPRLVRLHDSLSGAFVSQVLSGFDGHFEFNNLDASREYYLVAFDSAKIYEAVAADRMVPE